MALQWGSKADHVAACEHVVQSLLLPSEGDHQEADGEQQQ